MESLSSTLEVNAIPFIVGLACAAFGLITLQHEETKKLGIVLLGAPLIGLAVEAIVKANELINPTALGYCIGIAVPLLTGIWKSGKKN